MGKEEGDEFELNLELSIGGGYGKAENSKGEVTKFCGENVGWEANNCGISRSNFSIGAAENVCEAMDLQRRKEIQALRRQKARRKREEKIRKARGQNGIGFSEDSLFLEAQKLQARVLEREARERDCSSAEKARKKYWNSGDGVADDLSLSLFVDSNISSQQQAGSDCLYPKVQQQCSAQGNGVFPVEKNGNSSVDCDSERSNGINDRGNGNRSWEQCSSAVSDYQSMSCKGGSSSDTGSHSSRQRRQHPMISRNRFVQLESHDSSSQAQTDQLLEGPKVPPLMSSHPQSRPDRFLDRANVNASSASENQLSRETSGLVDENPPNNKLNAASVLPRMPCVSATGKGPNGRTVTGLLYKYTKAEVSIVCVCHGTSFSPAEFVEHAGGVDVSHPLKHITIVPTVL